MYAIRFARAFTGRDKLLKFERCFHGGHDAVLVNVKPARAKSGDPGTRPQSSSSVDDRPSLRPLSLHPTNSPWVQ